MWILDCQECGKTSSFGDLQDAFQGNSVVYCPQCGKPSVKGIYEPKTPDGEVGFADGDDGEEE